jgi:hypothetical protein
VDELVRSKIHEALGVEQPDGGLRTRVLSSLPVDEPPGRRFQMPSFQWAGGLVAVVLAVAIVASLLYFRGGIGQKGPATTGPVGQVTIESQVPFRCSLPIQAYYGVAAQVQLPAGTVVNESKAPASSLAKGSGGPYGYDPQLGKWLPVQQGWISPDGKSYAYATQTTGVPGQGPTSTVHVVQVATGRDQQVWSGDGAAQVLAYASSGIYFSASTYLGPAQDIWVVDPGRPGPAHRVGPNPAPPPPSPVKPSFGPSTFFTLVSPLGIFGMGFSSPADPTQPPTGAIGPDRVIRMDLNTGTVSTWFVNPSGGTVALLGLDSQGHPLIGVAKEPPPPPSPGPNGWTTYGGKSLPNQVLMLTGENQSTEIASGGDSSFLPVTAIGDAHGVWISVPGSVWLYDRAAGLRKVFSVPDSLFPAPTPPPGADKGTPPPGMVIPTPPPGMPTGLVLMVIGPCT